MAGDKGSVNDSYFYRCCDYPNVIHIFLRSNPSWGQTAEIGSPPLFQISSFFLSLLGMFPVLQITSCWLAENSDKSWGMLSTSFFLKAPISGKFPKSWCQHFRFCPRLEFPGLDSPVSLLLPLALLIILSSLMPINPHQIRYFSTMRVTCSSRQGNCRTSSLFVEVQ